MKQDGVGTRRTLCILAAIGFLIHIGVAQAPSQKETSQKGKSAPLHAVVNQLITLPVNGPYLNVNVRDGKATAWYERIDPAGGTRTPLKPVIQSDDNGQLVVHGYYYLSRIYQSFSDTGLYRVNFSFTGIAEDGETHVHSSAGWLVDVRFPELTMGISIAPVYYFGTNAFVNFAARELTDPESYRYVITSSQGDTVESGQGSFVLLDKILHDVNYAKEGRSFTVTGFYKDSVFKFLNPLNHLVEESIWKFRVKAPDLELVSPWEIAKDFGKTPKAFDMHQRVDWGPLQFGFILNAIQGDTWLHIRPDPQAGTVHVKSDPPDFLPQSESQRFKVITGTDVPWFILELKPASEFFQTIPQGGTRSVKLTIQIKTQFDDSPKSFVVFGNVY